MEFLPWAGPFGALPHQHRPLVRRVTATFSRASLTGSAAPR
jgi:hypothetical protein